VRACNSLSFSLTSEQGAHTLLTNQRERGGERERGRRRERKRERCRIFLKGKTGAFASFNYLVKNFFFLVSDEEIG